MVLVHRQPEIIAQDIVQGPPGKISLAFAADISQREARHPIKRSDGVSNELSLATL